MISEKPLNERAEGGELSFVVPFVFEGGRLFEDVIAVGSFAMERRAYAALDPLINVGQCSGVPRNQGEELPEILTIKDAARVLGVSEPTLRRWDESGKFVARRHPVNGYRLYDRAKVLAMRKKIFGRAA